VIFEIFPDHLGIQTSFVVPMIAFGVGMSCLGTSEAVAIGAYVFALRKLDGK
jgi:hypothetical protein